MRKAELLRRMRTERATWEELLAQVPRERIEERTLHDYWSVKDTIGHIAYYERWVLDWLEDAVRGKVTVASHRDLVDVDTRNKLIYEENKNRSVDDILRESREVFERLYSLVQTLPEDDLQDPHRFERYVIPFWQTIEPLWKCIAGDTFEHYHEHIPNLRKWLERVKRKELQFA